LEITNSYITTKKTVQPVKVELKANAETGNHVLVNDDLKISFRRTIRVPNSKKMSHLPPDLGAFPLKPVSGYANKLTPEMAAKGGLLFPMYRKRRPSWFCIDVLTIA